MILPVSGRPPGGAGQDPLFASAMIPGALTIATEPPHVPAFYAGTATEIYVRLTAAGASGPVFTIYHKAENGDAKNSQEVNMGGNLYESQAINWNDILDTDYFYIDVTAVVGSPTDLVWQVRP